MQELRSSVRFPLRLPIALKSDIAEQYTAETTDISAGGVLFEVNREMEIGTPIHFRIAMPASVLGTPTDVMVSCMGRVVRCTKESGRRAIAAVIDEYRFERC